MARTYIFKATGTAYAGSVIKTPAERFAIGVDMSRQLRGATLQTVSTVVTDLADASVVTSTILVSANGVVVGNAGEVTVRTGTSGHRYRVAFILRDSLNRLYEEGLLLIVR